VTVRLGQTATAAILSLAGCHGGRETRLAELYPRAPIVLVSIDTLRSDRLPAYGFAGVATPAIDALVRDGVVFERAYSHCPLTLPSHLSILSGLLPAEHGVRDNLGYAFAAREESYLPLLLRRRGYATAAAVSAEVLRGATGIRAGFDRYDDEIGAASRRMGQPAERGGRQTVAAAVDWARERLARDPAGPFFLFVHLYEPHSPYSPPPELARRHAEDAYLGEVAAADVAVGELLGALRRLGVYERAVVALLSDHGEGLGEHGESQHGIFLYRESLQVPLILKLPGARQRGRRIARPVGLADVAPTLLGLVSADVPAGWRERSLLGDRRAAPVFAETLYPRLHLGWRDLASVIADAHHYVDAGTPELYDLGADPAELRDLAGDPSRGRLATALRVSLESFPRGFAPATADADAAVASLRSLGYLTSGAAAGAGNAHLPDPKTELATLRRIEDAYAASMEGRSAAAVAELVPLLEREPHLVDMWVLLAAAYQELGRPPEALAALEKAAAHGGARPHLLLPLAELHAQLGEWREARRLAERARAAHPQRAAELELLAAEAAGDEAAALAVLRRVLAEDLASRDFRRRAALRLAEIGRPDEAVAALAPLAASGEALDRLALAEALVYGRRHGEARAVLEQLLATAPDDARAHEQLAAVLLRLDALGAAEDHVERALELDARRPRAWNARGVLLRRRGDSRGAIEAWRRAVELDPRYYDALYNLGLVAAQEGELRLAESALARFVAAAPPQRYAPDLERARDLLRRLRS
jgi:arylsulfatase A-like enzyme/Flp pilus assembly protein TadD